jgi:hypothetical protein
VYVGWLTRNFPDSVTPELCNYHHYEIHELLNKKNVTYTDIRNVTSQISVQDVSISDITQDILLSVKGHKKKMEIIQYAASIDHAVSTTQGYRKPLFIEYLLNIAVYGLGRDDFKKHLCILSTSTQ